MTWWVAALVAGLCLLYFLDPNPRLDFSPFDQHDAESYLSLSQSLVDGRGYTRSLDAHYYVPHTTWPPGMAVLLMPMTFLSGVPLNLLLIKLGMIVYGVVGIFLAYLYARRLSSLAADAALRSALSGAQSFLLALLAHGRQRDADHCLVAGRPCCLNDIGWSRGMIRTAPPLRWGLYAGWGCSFAAASSARCLCRLPMPSCEGRRGRSCARWPAVMSVMESGFWSRLWRGCCAIARSMFRGSAMKGVNQLAMIFRQDPSVYYSPVRGTAEIFANMYTNVKWHIIYQIPKSIVPGLWPQSVWNGMGKLSAPVALLISAPILLLSFLSIRNLPAIIMYGCMTLLYLFYAMGGIDRFWVPVTCLMAISLPIGAGAPADLSRQRYPVMGRRRDFGGPWRSAWFLRPAS